MIYFVMFQWGPYNTFLMKATFERLEEPAPQGRAGRLPAQHRGADGTLRSHAGLVSVHPRGPPGRASAGKSRAAADAAAASTPDPPRIVSGQALDDAPLLSRHRREGVNRGPNCTRTAAVTMRAAGGRPPTLLVCAGDPSGDDLAARAVEAWLRLRPGGRVEGLGGPALGGVGLRPLSNSPVRWPFPSPTGLVEPLRAVPALLANAAAFVARSRRDDVAGALLVDLPDVNLPLGRLLRLAGARVVQAVAPQTWAWRPGRNRRLAASCDALAVILPFEEAYFRARGCPARFVGHPLVDRLGPLRPPAPPAGALRLALLPGSRPERVRHVLPPLLAAAAELARRGALAEVVVSWAPAIDAAELERRVSRAGIAAPVRLETRPPLEWLAPGGGDAAAPEQVWVAAGTASLEAAAAGIPACVVWRTDPLGYAVARRLVRGRFAGLPNRLLGREVLPERLQDALTAPELVRVSEELRRPEAFARAAAAAAELRALLGGPGFAERLARLVDEVVR